MGWLEEKPPAPSHVSSKGGREWLKEKHPTSIHFKQRREGMVGGETSPLCLIFQAKEGEGGWRRNIPPLSHISSKGGRGWLEEKHPPSVLHFEQRREGVVGG
jgi:hypothetical protein